MAGNKKIIYGLLAQLSIIHAVPLYLPNTDAYTIEILQAVGAVVHTSAIEDGSALYYKNVDGYHYMKLVGPKVPKGGGLYLTQKMEEKQFVMWLDAFVRGALLRDIRDRVANPTDLVSAMMQAIPNDPFAISVVNA